MRTGVDADEEKRSRQAEVNLVPPRCTHAANTLLLPATKSFRLQYFYFIFCILCSPHYLAYMYNAHMLSTICFLTSFYSSTFLNHLLVHNTNGSTATITRQYGVHHVPLPCLRKKNVKKKEESILLIYARNQKRKPKGENRSAQPSRRPASLYHYHSKAHCVIPLAIKICTCTCTHKVIRAAMQNSYRFTQCQAFYPSTGGRR